MPVFVCACACALLAHNGIISFVVVALRTISASAFPLLSIFIHRHARELISKQLNAFPQVFYYLQFFSPLFSWSLLHLFALALLCSVILLLHFSLTLHANLYEFERCNFSSFFVHFVESWKLLTTTNGDGGRSALLFESHPLKYWPMLFVTTPPQW